MMPGWKSAARETAADMVMATAAMERIFFI